MSLRRDELATWSSGAEPLVALDLVNHPVKPGAVRPMAREIYPALVAHRRRACLPRSGAIPSNWPPPRAPTPRSMKAAAMAYGSSKPATLHYTHELQRRFDGGVAVIVYEPGVMPGTGLSRGDSAGTTFVGALDMTAPDSC